MRRLKLVILFSAISVSSFSFASQTYFSLGSGWPFVANAQIEQYDGQHRWYLSGGLGLDAGVALGWEKVLDQEKRNSFGVVLGAIGIRDGDGERLCEQDNDFLCLRGLFDEETVYGVGLTYTHTLSTFDQSGWQINTVLGYGEGRETHEKSVRGGIAISYRF